MGDMLYLARSLDCSLSILRKMLSRLIILCQANHNKWSGEHRNCTHMGMVSNLLSHSTLPLELLMEALIIGTRILNRVPSKLGPKKTYESWIGKKPSLHHLHAWGCIWGCPQGKLFNSQQNELGSMTISCHFIRYSDE
jgi:hypothetical protein